MSTAHGSPPSFVETTAKSSPVKFVGAVGAKNTGDSLRLRK